MLTPTGRAEPCTPSESYQPRAVCSNGHPTFSPAQYVPSCITLCTSKSRIRGSFPEETAVLDETRPKKQATTRLEARVRLRIDQASHVRGTCFLNGDLDAPGFPVRPINHPTYLPQCLLHAGSTLAKNLSRFAFLCFRWRGYTTCRSHHPMQVIGNRAAHLERRQSARLRRARFEVRHLNGMEI